LASPAFTGVPTAPTAAALTSTTQLATTEFVTSAGTVEANARILADAAEALTRANAVADLQAQLITAGNELPAGMEVLRDLTADIPVGWYDTGARVWGGSTPRAFLSNRRPTDLSVDAVYWFDFLDKDTLFQDVGCTIPVEADGDPVNAFIAKDNVGGSLTIAPVPNATFDSDIDNWTLASGSGGTIAWSAGKMRVTRSSTTTSGYVPIFLEGGLVYRITAPATWISGASAQASIVLRDGASASASALAQKVLAAGASGGVTMTYAPSADATVYLHLTCAGGAGVIDFDSVSCVSDTRAVFVAVTETAGGVWRTDGAQGWLEVNEEGDIDDRFVCETLHGLGGATFKGGVCVGYRQVKPQAAWIWTASLISGDGNTAGLRALGLSDEFVIGGSKTTLADGGLRDKVAYAQWDRTTSTGERGRTKADLSALAVGGAEDDTALYLAARGNATPGAPLRYYDLIVFFGDIADEERDWLLDFANARAHVRYPARIFVLLVWGQSNADGRAPISDPAAPAGWQASKIVPGVWNWNGKELSSTYWLYPVGPTQCGGSWAGDNASLQKFGFIDVACAQLAETIPNLVICRVTQGGTGVDAGANPDGSWHVPSSELPAGTPSLFDALKNKFLALKAFCAEHGIECVVLGGFYHHGENGKAAPTDFKVDTEAGFAGVREFTGVADLPIVTGTIPTLSTYYSASVRADQLAIDAADDHVTYLDFSALTMLADNTHFDAAACVSAGELAADEMMDYIGDSYLIPVGAGGGPEGSLPDLGDGVAEALVQDIGSPGGLLRKGDALGKPASGDLENCNNLPLAGISDFGTGVAAAAAIAIAQLGSFVIYNSPSQRTLFDAIDDAALRGRIIDGSTTTADAAAIDAAITSERTRVAALGGGPIIFPSGKYFASVLQIPTKGFHMSGAGADSTEIRVVGNHTFITPLGSRSTSQGNTLAANALAGSMQITLTTGKGANVSEGSRVLVVSNALLRGSLSGQKFGQYVVVDSKAGDVLTLAAPLMYDFLTSDSAEVQNVTFVDRVTIEGLKIVADDHTVNQTGLSSFVFCSGLRLNDLVLGECDASAIGLFGCVDAKISGVTIHDLASQESPALLGYGINLGGLNEAIVIDKLVARRLRHAVTTVDSGTVMPIGEPVGVTMLNSKAIDVKAAGFDTHAPGRDIGFLGCDVIGGKAAGFQVRCTHVRIIGCSVSNVLGQAVYFPSQANALGTDSLVDGLKSRNTNLGVDTSSFDRRESGAIHDKGQRNIVRNCVIESCGGPAIEVEGSDWLEGKYIGNTIINPCKSTLTKKGAIWVPVTTATRMKLEGNEISASHTNMDNGISIPSANVHVIDRDNGVFGAQGTARVLNSQHLSIGGYGQGGTINSVGGAGVGVEIVSGVATLPTTDYGAGTFVVSGEGGLVDDLVTISSDLPEGADVLLRRGTGAITITTTGNIITPTGGNIVMSGSEDGIRVRRQANAWLVISSAV
jgi:hypothetical protein